MDDLLSLQNKRLLRVDEAARLLNVSRWTIYRWVEAGQLGGTRIGAGTLRIFSETVVALIDRHCVGAPIAAGMTQRSQAPVVALAGAKERKTKSGIGRRTILPGTTDARKTTLTAS
ncbi:MAG: helix-turn-helix domain-containing protein [Nitrospira sp.]|nr:helix-turn-helix domain-containing protein [Nitrospira sp.]MCP9456167.1 helix-turn-helix domain-containing protein [Nitrospira sp.]